MTSSPALQQQAPFPYSLFSSFRNLYPPSNNHINHIGPPFSRLALSDHAHDVIMRSADYRMIFASYRTSHADEDDSFASSLGLDPLEEEVIRRRNVRARVMERVLPQIVHSIVSGSGAIGETMHDAANNEEMHAPASQRTIEELTVTTVKDTADFADSLCAICQEDYIVGSEVADLPCKHHFHKACIVRWLGIKGTCPVCRGRVGEHAEPEGDEQGHFIIYDVFFAEEEDNGVAESPDHNTYEHLLRVVVLQPTHGPRTVAVTQIRPLPLFGPSSSHGQEHEHDQHEEHEDGDSHSSSITYSNNNSNSFLNHNNSSHTIAGNNNSNQSDIRSAPIDHLDLRSHLQSHLEQHDNHSEEEEDDSSSLAPPSSPVSSSSLHSTSTPLPIPPISVTSTPPRTRRMRPPSVPLLNRSRSQSHYHSSLPLPLPLPLTHSRSLSDSLPEPLPLSRALSDPPATSHTHPFSFHAPPSSTPEHHNSSLDHSLLSPLYALTRSHSSTTPTPPTSLPSLPSLPSLSRPSDRPMSEWHRGLPYINTDHNYRPSSSSSLTEASSTTETSTMDTDTDTQTSTEGTSTEDGCRDTHAHSFCFSSPFSRFSPLSPPSSSHASLPPTISPSSFSPTSPSSSSSASSSSCTTCSSTSNNNSDSVTGMMRGSSSYMDSVYEASTTTHRDTNTNHTEIIDTETEEERAAEGVHRNTHTNLNLNLHITPVTEAEASASTHTGMETRTVTDTQSPTVAREVCALEQVLGRPCRTRATDPESGSFIKMACGHVIHRGCLRTIMALRNEREHGSFETANSVGRVHSLSSPLPLSHVPMSSGFDTLDDVYTGLSRDFWSQPSHTSSSIHTNSSSSNSSSPLSSFSNNNPFVIARACNSPISPNLELHHDTLSSSPHHHHHTSLDSSSSSSSPSYFPSSSSTPHAFSPLSSPSSSSPTSSLSSPSPSPRSLSSPTMLHLPSVYPPLHHAHTHSRSLLSPPLPHLPLPRLHHSHHHHRHHHLHPPTPSDFSSPPTHSASSSASSLSPSSLSSSLSHASAFPFTDTCNSHSHAQSSLVIGEEDTRKYCPCCVRL